MTRVATQTDSSVRSAPLGFWMATALVVGNMIGSGIFLLPASMAPFGADNLSGWILTALGAITLSLVFARLSRALPGAGGPYAYTREAFGDLAGFTVAWGYWVAVWVGNAAIAVGAVGYLGEFAPWLVETPVHSALATLGVLWALTLVNCAGVRAAGWVQSVTTVLKLLPLAGVIVLLFDRLPTFAWPAPADLRFSLDGTAAAATLALWAMLGLESATVPADKVRNPARTIPRATLWGTAFTAVLSAVACGAVLLLVPAERLAGSNAPFAELMMDVWGSGAARAVSLFAAISALGALNGWILLQGELPLAMARDGLFVRAFARTSSRGTPVTSLVASSALVTVLVLFNMNRSLVGVFTFFVLLATTANLVAYLASALALLRLRVRAGGGSRTGPTAIGAIAVLGAVYSLGALAGAGKDAVLWGLVLLLAGLPVYWVLRRRMHRGRVPDCDARHGS